MILSPIDLSKLNLAQQQAVTHTEGPAVVYAGAGSGKTRVICTRIAWLVLQKQIPPSSILAVTFTNKATREMKERIEKSIGERSKYLSVSTFHSLCARFLRIYAREAGFEQNFSIFDDNDQKSILKDALTQLNIPDKILSVATVKGKIDRLKNRGLTPENYLEELKANEHFNEKERRSSFRGFGEQIDPLLIHQVYTFYQSSLKKQNAMDFNDLLLVMHQLLQNNKTVLISLQNRYRYFLIDEFQDTNPIQFNIVKLLSSHTENLFIVGDDDQSIYSWRGAEPSFILNFSKLFPNAITYKLEENYRSSDIIIKAATSLIKYNHLRADKTLYTSKVNGLKIKLKHCDDAYTEARFIVDEIFSGVKNDEALSNFCILYRTNAQSRSLEDELRRKMLPYVIYGGVRFYERAEVKLLLSYLKLLINPSDDASFQKIINTPRRGFGDTALEKLKELALIHKKNMLSILAEIAYGNLENTVCRSLGPLKNFIMNFQKWRSYLLDNIKSASYLLGELIHDCKIEEYIRNTYPEEFDERWTNILELKNAILGFENTPFESFEEIEAPQNAESHLVKFIEQAMLTVEPTRHNVQNEAAQAVTLMTIHSAKGLEFPCVFITGLEEGIFPHQNSINAENDVEEERRLMYVAVTRAQQKLILTRSRRHRYKDFMSAEESRFISEIPQDCIENLSYVPKKAPSIKTIQTNTTRIIKVSNDNHCTNKTIITADKIFEGSFTQQDQQIDWHTGQRIAHKVFGEGVIRGIEKGSIGYRLRIHFDTKGEKVLLHSYVTPI